MKEQDEMRITEWLDPVLRSDSCHGENISNRAWCEAEIATNPGLFRIVTNPKTHKIALERVK